eukprot:gene25006-27004_t
MLFEVDRAYATLRGTIGRTGQPATKATTAGRTSGGAMKKLINTPSETLQDFLKGFTAAHSSLIVADPAGRFVRRTEVRRDKVTLISGGGSGHEPLHGGFVGRGDVDGAHRRQRNNTVTAAAATAALSSNLAVQSTIDVYRKVR